LLYLHLQRASFVIDLPDHAEQTQWRLAVPHPEDGLFTNDKFRWVRYRQVPVVTQRLFPGIMVL
jgi:hypothetical protein